MRLQRLCKIIHAFFVVTVLALVLLNACGSSLIQAGAVEAPQRDGLVKVDELSEGTFYICLLVGGLLLAPIVWYADFENSGE